MHGAFILRFKYLLIFMLACLLIACGRSGDHTYEPVTDFSAGSVSDEYVIGIHPLHNPQRLIEVYGPIIDYINRKIPQAQFKLEASSSYAEYEKKLYAGHFAFAMPNPYQTLQSLKYGYHVFGKMGDDDMFRGIILVRRDSGIHQVADLKGKVVSYPSDTALAASMLPQYYLHTHGLDVNRDIENRYVGSQESSIENVLRGHAAAGATWPVPWNAFLAEQPKKAAQLEVKWVTEPLINNGWVVRDNVPTQVTDEFSRLLFDMHNSRQGRVLLSRVPISRFEPATDASYHSVGLFLENFSKTVRTIDY
jgi:phosphonate transport system substrate-binding protein